jgi:hypothetical protein
MSQDDNFNDDVQYISTHMFYVTGWEFKKFQCFHIFRFEDREHIRQATKELKKALKKKPVALKDEVPSLFKGYAQEIRTHAKVRRFFADIDRLGKIRKKDVLYFIIAKDSDGKEKFYTGLKEREEWDKHSPEFDALFKRYSEFVDGNFPNTMKEWISVAGQVYKNYREICQHCGEKSEHLKICSMCKSVRYCNSDCQKKDWVKHKTTCKIDRLAYGLALSSSNNTTIK